MRSDPAIDAVDEASCRPDFAALTYTAGFEERDQPRLREYVRVTTETLPIFVVHAFYDGVPVANCLLMMEALKEAGVPTRHSMRAGLCNRHGRDMTVNDAILTICCRDRHLTTIDPHLQWRSFRPAPIADGTGNVAVGREEFPLLQPDAPRSLPLANLSLAGAIQTRVDLLEVQVRVHGPPLIKSLPPAEGQCIDQHVVKFIAQYESGVTRAVMLLDAGASLKKRDQLLMSTPLGWACRRGRSDLVQLYLDRGADPVEADAEPWATPLAWATKNERDGIADLLRTRIGQRTKS